MGRIEFKFSGLAHWPMACALVAGCLLAPMAVFALAPVRVATHDQAPYGTYLADKSFDGVAVRVVACVLKRMGRASSIEVYPWERAQRMAKKGTADGFLFGHDQEGASGVGGSIGSDCGPKMDLVPARRQQVGSCFT